MVFNPNRNTNNRYDTPQPFKNNNPTGFGGLFGRNESQPTAKGIYTNSTGYRGRPERQDQAETQSTTYREIAENAGIVLPEVPTQQEAFPSQHRQLHRENLSTGGRLAELSRPTPTGLGLESDLMAATRRMLEEERRLTELLRQQLAEQEELEPLGPGRVPTPRPRATSGAYYFIGGL